jgi:hypothetical protein
MNASPIFHRLALLAPLLCLGFVSISCTGYQLQTGRPQALTHVKKISVPLFENKTLVPRGEILATNSVVDAITNDGTYHIATLHEADAVLEGTMESITYSQVRSTRLDTLRSEEMENTVTLHWQLLDAAPARSSAPAKPRDPPASPSMPTNKLRNKTPCPMPCNAPLPKSSDA